MAWDGDVDGHLAGLAQRQVDFPGVRRIFAIGRFNAAAQTTGNGVIGGASVLR